MNGPPRRLSFYRKIKTLTQVRESSDVQVPLNVKSIYKHSQKLFNAHIHILNNNGGGRAQKTQK